MLLLTARFRSFNDETQNVASLHLYTDSETALAFRRGARQLGAVGAGRNLAAVFGEKWPHVRVTNRLVASRFCGRCGPALPGRFRRRRETRKYSRSNLDGPGCGGVRLTFLLPTDTQQRGQHLSGFCRAKLTHAAIENTPAKSGTTSPLQALGHCPQGQRLRVGNGHLTGASVG